MFSPSRDSLREFNSTANPIDVFGNKPQFLVPTFISPCSSTDSLLALKEKLNQTTTTSSSTTSPVSLRKQRPSNLIPTEMPHASSRTEPVPLREERSPVVTHVQTHSHTRKRSRTAQACEKCRIRKARCFGGNPCDRCTKRHFQCEFSDSVRQRGPNRTGNNPSSLSSSSSSRKPRRHSVATVSTTKSSNSIVSAESPSTGLGLHFTPITSQVIDSDEDESFSEENEEMNVASQGLGLWTDSLPIPTQPTYNFIPHPHPTTYLPAPMYTYQLPPTLSPANSGSGLSSTGNSNFPNSVSPNPLPQWPFPDQEVYYCPTNEVDNFAPTSTSGFPWTDSPCAYSNSMMRDGSQDDYNFLAVPPMEYLPVGYQYQ